MKSTVLALSVICAVGPAFAAENATTNVAVDNATKISSSEPAAKIDRPFGIKEACVWNSQVFSLGATFCISKGIAAECHEGRPNDPGYAWSISATSDVAKACAGAALP
jgi:hypothetical protein